MMLKQTFSNHLRSSWISIIISILLFVWCWEKEFAVEFVIPMSIFYSLTTLPAIYIHISYFIKNKKRHVAIYSDKLEIINDLKSISLFNYEIKKIIIIKPASLDLGGIPLTPIEYYFFVKVITLDNKVYFLTCLLDRAIDEKIKKLSNIDIYRENGFAFLR